MENLGSLIAMILAEIAILTTFFLIIIKQKNKSQLKTAMICWLTCTFIWTLGSILQILFQDYPIDPVFFEKFAGIGVHYCPVAFLTLSIIFAKTKIKIKWHHYLFLIIPTISTILMFTNYRLMFEVYSNVANEQSYGPWFGIHTTYTYSLILIGLIYFLRYSFKHSGFFSRQSILIIAGISIPLVLNILGTLNIIPMTTYITPISFALMAIIYTLAIFRFGFMKVTPVALQRIVDRMSDAYLVLNEQNGIIDTNKTFLDNFKVTSNKVRDLDVFAIFKNANVSKEEILDAIDKTKNGSKTISFEKHFKDTDKYYNIEISGINNKNIFLGTLVLFKDITEHVKDQEMIVEKERLASLGQMIGGIAHNLKTPIMSIAGATEGLSDLIKEYDNAIGDSEVTEEDNHAIAKEMADWIAKTRTHLSYMSDIITTIKGQAVAFADGVSDEFTVDELVKHMNILMKHELSNALINLNTNIDIDTDTEVQGNINSLIQVINNIISNSIQAYNGKKNENIEFSLYEENDNLVIKIEDYAGGLPDKVKDKLFKEMITTKGKDGSGLGLFMSHSNIKAHFNGNMRFESETGKGTTFYIELPL